jgi:hypothetical protein
LLLSCGESSTAPPEEPGDLLDRINALPGVHAREIEPYYGYPRAFEIDVTQPVDHDNPSGPTFTQRAYLSHASEATPMVFAPSGYAVSEWSGQELAGILQTNCLNVTHRYFQGARPDVVEWRYLTVRQAAADHHRIVALFKQIYPAQWISTGASKGGETVLFHRRFYPDDVNVTVAYVAPLLFNTEDERFIPYLRSVTGEADWQKIHSFQRMLLLRRESLLPTFENWFVVNGYRLSIPAAPTFESAVVSYQWSFWQRHIYEVSSIPGAEASSEDLVNHLAEVVRLQNRSDEMRAYYQPYIYQALTEIGLPALDLGHLEHLIVHEPMDPKESYSFPESLEFVYRYETIPEVISWLQTQGNNIVFLYGSLDPWTGGAVELTGQTNALKIVQDGADHGVRIEHLGDRGQVLATLEEWLDLEIQLVAERAIAVPPLEITDDPWLQLDWMPATAR